MSLEDLPVLASVQVLPDVQAVLTLESGEVVKVTLEDRPIMTAPTPDVALLLRWDNPQTPAQVYRVPEALCGLLAYALGCQPPHAPPLSAVTPSPEAVSFEAGHADDFSYSVTVPRPVLATLSQNEEEQPAVLSVRSDDKARAFRFLMWPADTAHGAAWLDVLKRAGVTLTGEEEG